jgi:hypothetical protein
MKFLAMAQRMGFIDKDASDSVLREQRRRKRIRGHYMRVGEIAVANGLMAIASRDEVVAQQQRLRLSTSVEWFFLPERFSAKRRRVLLALTVTLVGTAAGLAEIAGLPWIFTLVGVLALVVPVKFTVAYLIRPPHKPAETSSNAHGMST